MITKVKVYVYKITKDMEWYCDCQTILKDTLYVRI